MKILWWVVKENRNRNMKTIEIHIYHMQYKLHCSRRVGCRIYVRYRSDGDVAFKLIGNTVFDAFAGN